MWIVKHVVEEWCSSRAKHFIVVIGKGVSL